ncbi:MAG: T9SS type A sorting domain-containing protein [Bacteroidetes bacterium]|nr:T9SS type A sorting domain-containing protein [Bacteroidota bacterium]
MKSEDGEDPIELTVSDFIDYDSTMIGTWVTLPLEMDGESEFLFEGDFVYACVEYNNMNTDLISHRYENFQVGSDSDRRILDPVSVARSGDNLTWLYDWYVSERNLMIRMNINDHSNIIDDVDLTVTLTSLDQNYPNPFINTTEIAYELAASSDVIIELMDLTGRTVLRIDEGLKTAGKQTATLNADDLESGVYFYTLTAGKYSETKKMVVR